MRTLSSAKTVVILVIYCISGTLLTLVNKITIVTFPRTNSLLMFQNGMAVILLILVSRCMQQTTGSLPILSLTIAKLWLPLVFLFVIMLTSSLLALLYVSIPTVIVMRNLTALFVAILEYISLNNKIGKLSAFSLVAMLSSAIIYAKHDLTFNISGYAWLSVNIIATSVYQISIKSIIHHPAFRNVGPIGMSYYNNLISLPVLLIISLATGEIRPFSLSFNSKILLETKNIVLVSLSGLLGFSLSISAFKLNEQISATSMMVANNVNKFVVIIVSEIFVQATLDIVASTGAILVLIFGWLYSQSEKPPSKNSFAIIAVIFVTLCAILEYKHSTNNLANPDHHFPFHSIHENHILSENDSSGTHPREYNARKIQGDIMYGLFLPKTKYNLNTHRMPPGITIDNRTTFQLPEYCENKNSPIWKHCHTTLCTLNSITPSWSYPETTLSGEDTGDFISRVLEVAWGSKPPTVDLYLRSGCHGIMEMKYLFESIKLFWPRFLGSIIIVVDASDEKILKLMLPSEPNHHYVIKFEHTPCLPGRVFNQYSYMNIDRYSTAEYVVTIDSDCIFHSPVTPDLIFRQGKVILASSQTFQSELWVQSLNAMMGPGMYNGHYMVTQPIAFSVSTFSSFREWFYKSKRRCYEDQLSSLPPIHYAMFCWMCQLGTYLESGQTSQTEYEKYWYQHLDNKTLEPILRYSIHLPHEPYNNQTCKDQECYEKFANEIITQGLCRAFGPSRFKICTNYSKLDYIHKVTFLYANIEIQAADLITRNITLRSYLQRLQNIIEIVLGA
jgi:GDP-mannose transporter